MPKSSRGPGRIPIDPVIRFWSKVEKAENCWLWTAQINRDGYGRFYDGVRKVLAHRFSWELLNGPIDPGLEMDHRCHNRSCVRPEHLRLVTRGQNMQNLTGAQKRNKTGIRGVTWDASTGRYLAQVTAGGKHYYIGRFDDVNEAADRVKESRLRLHTHNDLDRIA